MFFLTLVQLLTVLPAVAYGAKIILAGDSTMAQSSSATQQGWGTPFAKYTSLQVLNLARGGRSVRSYNREGLWTALVAQIQTGDYVVIEFGHNDGGNPSTSERASVVGTGSETQIVRLASGQIEVVQTFVTYHKRMINDVLRRGGIPIVSSQTPNGDAWNEAKTKIGTPPRFVGYSKIAAESNPNAVYMDHWGWCAVRYEDMGYKNVYPKLFPQDHTHTNPAGADVVAQAFVNGLKCTNHPLSNNLTEAGKAIPKVCS